MLNPINLINAIPLHYRVLILMALFAAAFSLGWLKGAHSEQVKAARFEATTEALGKAALERNARIAKDQQSNLEAVKNELAKNIKQANYRAAINYRARYGMLKCPGSDAVPRSSEGKQGNDAPTGEPLAADPGFIRDCARDAATLSAWQSWAVKNTIPVE
jgi:hypothetical protein